MFVCDVYQGVSNVKLPGIKSIIISTSVLILYFFPAVKLSPNEIIPTILTFSHVIKITSPFYMVCTKFSFVIIILQWFPLLGKPQITNEDAFKSILKPK